MVQAQYTGPYPITLQHATEDAVPAGPLRGFQGALHFRLTEHAMPIDAYRMVEDARGTFWVATGGGLLRMDGDRHKVYRHARRDSLSLPNNRVTDVAVDGQGYVWVGTQDGLARLDPGTGAFKTYRNGPEMGNPVKANRFWRLVVMGDGRIWTATEVGVFLLRPGSDVLEAVIHEEDGVDVFGENQVGSTELDLTSDGRGIIVSCLHGSYVLGPGSTRFERVSVDPPSLRMKRLMDHPILPMPDGSFWSFCGRTEELRHWHPDKGILSTWPELAGGPIAGMGRMLHLTDRGELLLGLWDGRLLVLDPTTGRSAQVLLPGNTSTPGPVVARSIMVDSHGRTWLCTKSGLYALLPTDPRISVHAMPGHWHQRSPLMVSTMPDGTFAFGKTNHGLVILEPSGGLMRTWPVASQLPGRSGRNDQITSMERTPDGRILLGTYHGVMEADTVRGGLVYPSWFADAPEQLQRTIVTDLAQLPDGTLWMATWHNGLYKRDARSGAYTHYSHNPGLPHSLPIDRILSLLVDREGTLWVGTNDGGGIVRYDPALDGFIPLPDPEGDAAQAFKGVVRCMVERADGLFWVGTHQTGLHLVDPRTGAYSSYDLTDGLPGDVIYQIIEHPRYGIWVAGNAGVAHSDDPALGFKRIDLGFEPSGDEVHIALDTLRGLLCATHRSDVVLLDLTVPRASTPAPTVAKLDLRVNGVPVSEGEGPLRLQRGRDRLQVEFGVQDPILARDTRVGHRLLGLNEDWDDCLGCRSLNYADLSTGAYRLEMRAQQPDGTWGPTQRIVELSVFPPFWATWWFRSGMAVLLVALIMGASRLHLQRRLAAQRVAFEREQALMEERMRIASDMHDDLGAGLSALKLRSEMALRYENDPQKREHWASLARIASELINSMRQIIWTMDGGQTTLEDLVVYATNYARSYLAENGISCTVDLPHTWPSLRLGSKERRDLFLVIKEALHNVVKHAGARSVVIQVGTHPRFSLSIADDGRGLPAEGNRAQGNGLRNMRMRVEGLGGTFAVDGSPGTRITIVLPVESVGNGSTKAPAPGQGGSRTGNPVRPAFEPGN